MKCNTCDTEILEGSLFCPGCGARVISNSGPPRSTKGRILDYEWKMSRGTITGDDGYRYQFIIEDWKSERMPVATMTVNLVVD